jgi:hypothetical protein
MPPPLCNANGALSQLILVRLEPAGQYTASVVGLPELRATAATREEAVQQAGAELEQWLASGRLQAVTVTAVPSPLKWFGHTNPSDPDEQGYLEELARFRQEDLEQSLREDNRE